MVTYGVLILSCIGCLFAGACITLVLVALLSANGRDEDE